MISNMIFIVGVENYEICDEKTYFYHSDIETQNPGPSDKINFSQFSRFHIN